jgi:NAD(P)H-dependent FMN reductase
MESRDITVLLVTGSTRAAAPSTAALRGAATAAPAGVRPIVYDGLDDLPPFVADAPEAGPAVAGLRELLAAADAALFSTPEYAGTLPGALRNLLDWAAGTAELDGKPVAVLRVDPPGRGDGADAALRTALRRIGAVLVEEACVRVPVPDDAVSAEGVIADPGLRARLGTALGGLANSPHVRRRLAE